MRLLIWNIENFTLSRISDCSGNSLAEQMDNAVRSFSNLNYILSTVTQADPDVFVIVESLCHQGNIEELADGDGALGLLVMRSFLQSLSDQWFLVPPLRVNPKNELALQTRTETVGVFWRNDRVQFTGPYVWPAARVNTGPPVPPGAQTQTAAYPNPWNGVVPPGTTAAARCRFYDANRQEIIFAAPDNCIDPANATAPYTRRPYLTTFTERNGMRRNIKLFSVHTKPAEAYYATINMLKMQPQDWVPGNNEATVFAGDFNLNLKVMDPYTKEMLNRFREKELVLAVPSLVNDEIPLSRIFRRKRAAPDNYQEQELLDYGFIRYGPGAMPNPLPASRSVVIDRVVGVTPGGGLPAFTTDMFVNMAALNQFPPDNYVDIASTRGAANRLNHMTTITTRAAHGLSVGDAVIVSGVANTSFEGPFQVLAVPNAMTFTYEQEDLANAQSNGGRVNTQPKLNIFRRRENYGHITRPRAGTSDHLPVFIIV